MRAFWQAAREFFNAEDGPTAVEYAVMLALIIVVCIAVVSALGRNVGMAFHDVNDSIN